jgi:hypothetical protein
MRNGEERFNIAPSLRISPRSAGLTSRRRCRNYGVGDKAHAIAALRLAPAIASVAKDHDLTDLQLDPSAFGEVML